MNKQEQGFSIAETKALRTMFAKRQVDLKLSRINSRNEGLGSCAPPFFTATARFDTAAFPEGKWWEDKSQTVRPIFPIEPEPMNGSFQNIKQEMRELLLDRLGFFDKNGELTKKAEEELMQPHYNKRGERVFFTKAPFHNVFLEYLVREHKDPDSDLVNYHKVSECIRQVPDIDTYTAEFKNEP